MSPIRILFPVITAFAVVSCGTDSGGGGQYDTGNPSYGAVNQAPAAPPSNPVYDTPAAYEDNATTHAGTPGGAITPYNPEPSATPSAPVTPTAPSAPSTPVVPAGGPGIIHTVVAGDTLSGISAKYKVPSAAIKQANNMKNDTVVLGRKMVIPAAR